MKDFFYGYMGYKKTKAAIALLDAMIAADPSIVNTGMPSELVGDYPYYFGVGKKLTPLHLALHELEHMELAIFLIDKGARTINVNDPEPFLIQAIYQFRKLQKREKREAYTDVIRYILTVLSPDELQMRSTTGQTPYMVAIQQNLPEDLIEEIRIATNAQPTNKNIYKRTANNYRSFKNHPPMMPASLPGGRRRKTRRRLTRRRR
jgi:hypothetical protein